MNANDLKRLGLLAISIAVAGFLGGSVAYAAGLIGNEHESFVWTSLLLNASVGAAAALFGVFLLANSDTSSAAAVVRACVFAIACGATWQPIMTATRALVSRQITSEHVTDQLTTATNAVDKVSKSGTADAKADVIQRSVQTATDGITAIAKLPNTSGTDSTKEAAKRLIQKLDEEYGNSPESFADPAVKRDVLTFKDRASLAYPELGALPASENLQKNLAKVE